MSQENATKKIPLWARLRIAHDFADDDEKKKLETLAQDIIDKHPDIQTCDGAHVMTTCQDICLHNVQHNPCIITCQTTCLHNIVEPTNPCIITCQMACLHSCQNICLHTCQVTCLHTGMKCQHLNMIPVNPDPTDSTKSEGGKE